MKKILVFGITENPGGVESVIMNYYRNIDRSKIQFDFLCNTEVVAYEDEIKNLGGTIYRITARSKDRRKFKEDLTKFFEEHSSEYSTIWVNVCSLANIDYLKYAKKYGIKYRIIHCHNAQNMDSKLRSILHYINRCSISKYATDFWTCNEDSNKWFYGSKNIKNNKIVKINNAIDSDEFRFNQAIRDKYRKELDLDNKFVIGHVGRFHFQKNQLFLIDVFNEIHKEEPNSELLLIGQGEDENKIVNRINELKLNNSVKLLGVREDVNNLMSAMDVFVFPSVFEGLGIVLLEAQASGLPVVSSNDNTPLEVKMTDNFKFLSLNDSINEWVNAALSFKDINRNTDNSFLEKNNYDIKTEAKKIEKYFERN